MNKNRNRHTGKVNSFTANIQARGKSIEIGGTEYKQLNNSKDPFNLGTIVRK